MNRLSKSERVQILQLLCDGMAIQAISCSTGKSKNTITKLLVDAGYICRNYQDKVFCNLNSQHIQINEIWSFCYTEKKNVAKAKVPPGDVEDVWTWTAIDADSKLVMLWLVGRKDSKYAMVSVDNLKSRLANRVQLTSGRRNVFSKKIENHAHAVSLHFMYYNFCCIHKSLRITPAMQAGVTDKLWDMTDIVALVEAEEAKKPHKRSSYRKRVA